MWESTRIAAGLFSGHLYQALPWLLHNCSDEFNLWWTPQTHLLGVSHQLYICFMILLNLVRYCQCRFLLDHNFQDIPSMTFTSFFWRVRSSVMSAVPVSLSKSFAISSFVQGENLIRSTQNWQPCERAIDLLILWPVHYVHFVTQCANYTLQMHKNDRLSPAQSMLNSMRCNIVVLDYRWANQRLKSAGWNCKEKKNSGKNGCGFLPLHSASRIPCSWFKY